MRILFIGEYLHFENLTTMFLSGFLKKHGYECHYIDIRLSKNLVKEVKEINPTIIAYSILTATFKKYLKINSLIKKEHQFFSIFGGLHCTIYPEIIYEEGVDAICRGEGEIPLLELVKCIEDGSDISQIKNLWVKINNVVYKNDLRALVQNLDDISFPDRTIFDKYYLYRKIHSRTTIASRGCPHSCTYCYNNIIQRIYKGKGKYVRTRSVSSVINELKEVNQKYKPNRFKLFDDSFIKDKAWGLEFCDLYEKEISIPFIAVIRLNYFDEELVIAMKKAGCIAVSFGIECGNEQYRNQILKRNMSNSHILHTSNLFKKHGIKTNGLNIVGLPGETIDMCIETIRFNISCKVSFANTGMYTPYPDTELAEYAIQNGFFDGNYNNVHFNTMFNKGTLVMTDIKKIKRLQYLFSIVVACPFLLHFLKFLISLPLMKFYQSIFFMHRVYNHLILTKQFDWQDIFIFELKRNKRKLY